MSIIVYGLPGCGKTKNAERIAKYFNCDDICDDGHDPYPLSEKQQAEFKAGATLFLTNIFPEDKDYRTDSRRILSYDLAIKLVGGRI